MKKQFGLYALDRHENLWGPTVMQKRNLNVMLQQTANSPGGCQKATRTMVKLLGATTGKTLESLISRFPTKEFDSTDDYTWDVIASTERNIPLIEARLIDGTVVSSGMVGVNGEPFYLVFGEHYFADGETLEGNLNEIYQMRILEEPRDEGTTTVYKVKLLGGNMDGIPAERLQAGERFSNGAAFVEEGLSRKVGGIRFATPMGMRNEFSCIRKHAKVSGDMLNAKLLIDMPVVRETKNGTEHKTISTWMHYQQWVFESEFQEEKNWALAWGRCNANGMGERNDYGKSGNIIKIGAGLFQQMEAGNTFFYNKFSLEHITSALYELSQATKTIGDRTFVMCTGEKGAEQFHKAILDIASGWTWAALDNGSNKFVRQVSSTLHRSALGAGFQFVEYYAPNGVTVKLNLLPFYDDKKRNKILDSTGAPLMSRRYDIFDLGSSEEQNIFRASVKGQAELTGFQWGLRNPWTGKINNDNMSYDEDSASIHKMAFLGVGVLDPTRTMSIIPNGLAG